MNRRTRRIQATILTVILAISLVLGNLTPAVLAAEEHVHDETCGYSDGQCVYESDELEEAGEDAGEAEEKTDGVLAESATVAVGLSSMMLTSASEDDELSFGNYEGMYAVVANNYTGTSYTIPYSYNDKVVEAIAASAFSGCTNLTTITFSSNGNGEYELYNIGIGAFSGCTNLSSIILPDSLLGIRENVFFGCTGLTSITIPDSVTFIDAGAFFNCTSLQGTLTLPESLTDLDTRAFSGAGYVDGNKGNQLTIRIPVSEDTLFTLNTDANIQYYYVAPIEITLSSDGTVSWTGMERSDVRYHIAVYKAGQLALNTYADAYVAGQSGSTSYSYQLDTSEWETGTYTVNVNAVKPANSDNGINDSTVVAASGTLSIYSTSTITFDANGGSVDTSTATTGSDGTLSSLPTPTRTGYIFDGWYTEATDGDEVTTSTVFESNTKVYAHWTECTHEDSTMKPTCTESATCSVCGGTIAELGHNFTGDYDGCDESGHWHVCKNDGCNATDTKQDHIFNDADYKYNNDATYTSDGTETATCAAAGCTYTNTRTKAGTKLTDNTLPTGTITVKENTFTSFINTITFGIFGKNSMNVTIDASDAETGVESVEYLIYEVSDGDTGLSQSDLAEMDGWLTYNNSFSMSSDGKYIIYAKITDKSDNVAYISSDGIVKYTDAAADTQEISFTKTSTAGVAASVTANGNTISAITNGSAVLGSDDYSVSYNTGKNTATITFSASYLDSLTEGSYTLTITYNPQGETYVEDENNDAPESTSMGLFVSRANGSVTITDDLSKTYDGTEVSAPTYSSLSSGTAAIEYKVNDADDTTYTSTAPADAGSYTVRVTVAADDNYTEASATADFTISPRALTVTADDKEITYGDAAPTYTVTCSGFEANEDSTVLGGTLTFACEYTQYADSSEYIITPSGYDSDNYTITYQTGTLTVKPKAVTVTVDSKSSVYGDSIVELTAKDSGIINGDTDVYSLSTKASSTAGVGTYDITGAARDANYSITFEGTTGAYEITARELTVDVTVSDKQYDGTTSATIDSATLQNIANRDAVSLINGTATFESAEVGTGINISFTDFTLSGDADVLKNYTLTQPTGVTASINNDWKPAVRTEYTVTSANANGWLNTDFTVTAAAGYELSLNNTAESTWSDTLTETTDTDSGSITFYVRDKLTGAISLAATETYKIDKTAPTGTVSIGNGTTAWDKFLETISFGLYYNSAQKVSASADDQLSGMDKIEYVESESTLTLNALKALADDEWTAMGTATGGSVTVPLKDGKQFIYYIRLTDVAGNITYLSTDGATYDTSVPVISGIVNGKTYCESVAFTADDENLDYVMVNGERVNAKDAADYSLTADGTTYTITAYDKAGNSTQVTVTVNNGHTFTNYVSDGNAGCTEDGTETAKCEYCDVTNTRTETGSATGHSWSSDWSNDADYHWHECTNDGCTLTNNRKKGSYGTHSDSNGDGLCDDCGYIMEIERIQTQIVQTDLTEVPDGLKDTEFDTVEKITNEITRVLTSEVGYTEENVAVYDVKLQISTDGGKTWIDATEANFPAEGITIVLPYPDGTDGSTHDFTVTHMFTVTSAKLGITAGETEQPEVTKLTDGIQVTLKGLSPVGVAWKELSTNDAAGSGNDIKATDTTETTGTAESSGSTDTVGSVQTGDKTNILLWIVVMILSATGITVIIICDRKRKYNR